MSVQTPTLEYREKDPDTINAFYNEFESVIKSVKSRDNLVKAGDFNSETGTAALGSNIYRKQIAIYRKGRANCNGYSLLELTKSQSFKLINTSFKDKQCHRSKKESPIKINQTQNTSRV